METQDLATLERVANNLPVLPGTLRHGFVPTTSGDIYLAWGRSADKKWHGIACWSWNRRSVAICSEHGWALTEAQVQKRMFDYAHENAKLFVARGLHSDGGHGKLA